MSVSSGGGDNDTTTNDTDQAVVAQQVQNQQQQQKLVKAKLKAQAKRYGRDFLKKEHTFWNTQVRASNVIIFSFILF